VVDAEDHRRVIAISTGSGVSLGDVPPGFYPVDNPVLELTDAPDLPALRDVFGVVPGDGRALQIPKVTPEIASPHSALHQGPINIALEAAMTDELERMWGSATFQVEHYTVMFIKPGYVGPFVATATVVNSRGPRFGVEATMVDEGRENRIIATSSAAFRKM
jgi:acyl-coenzyme A thioesterase PaaI-like protein